VVGWARISSAFPIAASIALLLQRRAAERVPRNQAAILHTPFLYNFHALRFHFLQLAFQRT
jgi:hypothetical protein